MSINPPRRQLGLSLVELIIFMVVVGIAAVAVLQIMNISAKSSADPVRRKQALLLAESYLEEVELARFTYCDPTDPLAATAADANSCTTPGAYQEGLGQEPVSSVGRPYDNVSDYAAAPAGSAQQSFKNAAGDLTDVNGAPIDAVRLAGYSATVALNYVSNWGPSSDSALQLTSDATPANFTVLRITVQVRYGTGANDVVTLDGYRTRYAPTYVP